MLLIPTIFRRHLVGNPPKTGRNLSSDSSIVTSMSVESFAVSLSVDSMSAEKCLVFRQLSCSTLPNIAWIFEYLDRAKHTLCVPCIGFSVVFLVVYLVSGPWRRISIRILLACYTDLVVTKKKKKVNKISLNPCFMTSALRKIKNVTFPAFFWTLCNRSWNATCFREVSELEDKWGG